MPSSLANRIAPANYLPSSFLCYVINRLYGLVFSLWHVMVQDIKALTLFWITALQIGHTNRKTAHSLHTTRWPQGTNTTETSLSRHTLHNLSSCRRCSCSSVLSWASSFPKKERKAQALVFQQPQRDSPVILGSHTAGGSAFHSETDLRWQKYLSHKLHLSCKAALQSGLSAHDLSLLSPATCYTTGCKLHW